MGNSNKTYKITNGDDFDIQLFQNEWNFLTFVINNSRNGYITEPQDCGAKLMELEFLMSNKLCFVHGIGSQKPRLQLHPLLIHAWCIHNSAEFKDIFPLTIPIDLTPKEYFTSKFFLENIRPSLSHNSHALAKNTLRIFELHPDQDAFRVYSKFAERFVNYEKIELYVV